MPINKKQLLRLIKLVSALKENRYPNTITFAKKLHNDDIDNNKNISCTSKTIQRDIKTLKEDFNAPIGFDYERKGYYLTHHGWDFYCPILQDEDMLASVLGAKIAEDIMPEPIKGNIRTAVEAKESNNNPDFMDTAFIKTLIVASGIKHDIVPELFKIIFEAWQKRHTINITYKSPDGKFSDRLIEPHVLAYYNADWYIKAFCFSAEERRIFAIHRIISAVPIGTTFTPDENIINSVIDGKLFDYKQVKDIELWCSKNIAGYVREHRRRPGESVKNNSDGSIILHLKEMSECELLKWIMSESGNVRIIKPQAFVENIISRAQRIIDLHQSTRL